MRVAVVSESFLPTVNGVTTSVVRVLDHLAMRGHEATVIVPAAGSPREYAGFRIHQVPALAYRQFPVGLPNSQVSGLLAAFRPDVLHVASPFLLGAQAIASANRLGVPSVAIYQTDVSGYARRNRLSAASAFAWRLVRWIHEGADLTLAPSTTALADLRAAGVPRLERWGRGVDIERYHPSRRTGAGAADLRARLAPDGETIVGYVGRVAPEKSLERLAELRDIPGMRLAVIGDGPAMPQVVRALDGMPVTFLGALGGDDLADAYAALDLFVHTGTEETFGQTLQEAHASGLPVVAPRAGGPIDLVEPGVDGLLYDPASDSDLRTAVAGLVAAPELRARMGEAGRRRVLGRSWAAICDDLLEFYARVMTDRALAGARI
ncbi:glycosyltransferase family 4 protein [Pseudolysinimonas yzui]|uniref:glycosyltransferase family 4 protein n=1 Tax=Pseudolysinimonas yzui TaxID=2708254 RepID=UPI001747E369|nr:glycosyltransferase family 1 protein [Pseudolysinimonas yzui]